MGLGSLFRRWNSKQPSGGTESLGLASMFSARHRSRLEPSANRQAVDSGSCTPRDSPRCTDSGFVLPPITPRRRVSAPELQSVTPAKTWIAEQVKSPPSRRTATPMLHKSTLHRMSSPDSNDSQACSSRMNSPSCSSECTDRSASRSSSFGGKDGENFQPSKPMSLGRRDSRKDVADADGSAYLRKLSTRDLARQYRHRQAAGSIHTEAADLTPQDPGDVHSAAQTVASHRESAAVAQLWIFQDADDDAAASAVEEMHIRELSSEARQRWRRIRAVNSLHKAVQDPSDVASNEVLAAIPERNESESPERKRLSKDEIYWKRKWQLFKARIDDDPEASQYSSELQSDLPAVWM